MFWTAGLIVVALVFGQVPAELVKPVFIEDAISGATFDANSRIVSGWEAIPGQHPHQISLRMVNAAGDVTACGGSIISREWAITAAHCTALRITLIVRAGVTSLTTPEYIFETHEWYNHPTYNDNFPQVVQPNDISVLKLARPVTYTKLLQPIRIQPSAEASADYDREVVYASGWGRLWTLGAQPEVLNWVYLRAISNQACQQVFGTALINDAAICAGWYNVTSQSTCQGDSGGPLVHVSSDRVPTLIGIASFVAGGDFGCHSGIPAGFIRPGPFLGWLKEVTGIDFENLNEEDDVTDAPTTVTPSTQAPTTSTQAPATSTQAPATSTQAPATSTQAPVTSTEPPATVPEPEQSPEESEESDEDDSDSEEDPEITELLKKLIVKVKVKVKINNDTKRKVKVKCVDKF